MKLIYYIIIRISLVLSVLIRVSHTRMELVVLE